MKRLPFSLILAVLVSGSSRPAAAAETEAAAPVKFLRNREVALGLYPEGYRFAASAAVAGLDLGEEDLPVLEQLVTLLANRSVRATLFIFPGETYRQCLSAHPRIFSGLARLRPLGFEIAQASRRFPVAGGTFRPSRDGLPPATPIREAGEIAPDRRFLAGLGREPAGYLLAGPEPRAPIISLLEEQNYLYCLQPSPAAGTAPAGQASPFYPALFTGGKVLGYSFSPGLDPGKLERLAGEISRDSGILVFHIPLSELPEGDNLAGWKRLLDRLKELNAWFCTLEELSGWWKARAAVGIETFREGDSLVIAYDNPTRFSLANARFSLLGINPPARYYRVESREGLMIAQGVWPESGFVNATLPSSGTGPVILNVPRSGETGE